MTTYYTAQDIASVFTIMLDGKIRDLNQDAFFVYDLPDRAIVGVNPANVKSIDAVYSDSFKHSVQTMLGGVRVEFTNHRGLFFQIGHKPKVDTRLESTPLDLSQQPDPLSVPIGPTRRGPLWINIRQAIGVIIAGTTGFGKTTLEHAWIRALIHGRACQLIIWDGKRSSEFTQYDGQSQTVVIPEKGIPQALSELRGEIARRQELFAAHGAASIDEYNQLAADQIQPIVLMIDEARRITDQYPEALPDLVEITATGRSAGVVSVIATQRTSSEEVLSKIKINLPTRICFAVPAVQDSRVVLDRSGAERIAKTPGRLLILWRAGLIEAQAYRVSAASQAAPDLPVGSDLRLAQRVVDETGGQISIPLLASLGLSEYRARVLLDQWKTRGWIDGDGQGTARRLSARVLEAISQSLKAPQSDLKVSKWPQSSVSVETE